MLALLFLYLRNVFNGGNLMNHLFNARIFVHDPDFGYVEVEPSDREKSFGRRMATMLVLMGRDWKKGRGKSETENALGRVQYWETVRGRGKKRVWEHHIRLDGSTDYDELRVWVAIGVQMVTGEYPLMVRGLYDDRELLVTLPSGKSMAHDYAS